MKSLHTKSFAIIAAIVALTGVAANARIPASFYYDQSESVYFDWCLMYPQPETLWFQVGFESGSTYHVQDHTGDAVAPGYSFHYDFPEMLGLSANFVLNWSTNTAQASQEYKDQWDEAFLEISRSRHLDIEYDMVARESTAWFTHSASWQTLDDVERTGSWRGIEPTSPTAPYNYSAGSDGAVGSVFVECVTWPSSELYGASPLNYASCTQSLIWGHNKTESYRTLIDPDPNTLQNVRITGWFRH